MAIIVCCFNCYLESHLHSQVNGVDMSSISHAEAVAFLRRCPDTVTIRLFRDSAVTPLSPLSPTEPELVGLNRPRPLLR